MTKATESVLEATRSDWPSETQPPKMIRGERNERWTGLGTFVQVSEMNEGKLPREYLNLSAVRCIFSPAKTSSRLRRQSCQEIGSVGKRFPGSFTEILDEQCGWKIPKVRSSHILSHI